MMNVKLLSFLLILFRLFCLGKGGKTYFSKPFKQGSPKQKILKHEQALYKAKMKQWESQRALLEVEEDLEISVGNRTLIPPDCYKPTKYDYISPRQCYTSMQRVNEFPPPCITNESQLAFINGSFSADATFYNCLANVPDAGSIASFYNGRYHGCSLHQSYITLLNLVKIDEVQGVASLQVIIDIIWTDHRFAMPLFWKNTQLTFTGIDLTILLQNDSVVMWKPQLTFPDASEVTMLGESFGMYPYEILNYTFVYEATFALTLVQPGYNFAKYPNDAQNIVIRYGLLNYDATQLQLFPMGIYCSELVDGSCTFSHNPIWSYHADKDVCTVYSDPKEFSAIWPMYVQYSLALSRQGDGVVVRLILPITFLLLLSAVTFWLSYENRVNTTITLLLSVSALYIVILQNIPMVGYLTNIDRFVFVMFVLLVVVVISHQVFGTMKDKVGKWPLRKLYMRFIEMIGRVALPPIIIGYFFYNISFANESNQIIMLTFICCLSGIHFYQESGKAWRVWRYSLQEIINKVNQPSITIKDISWLERLILNYLLFNMISIDSIYLSKLINEKGEIKLIDKKNHMELRKEFQLTNLLHGSNNDGVNGGGGTNSTTSVGLSAGGSGSEESKSTSGKVNYPGIELSRIGAGKIAENPLHHSNSNNSIEFSQRVSMNSFSRQSEISVDSDDDDEV